MSGRSVYPKFAAALRFVASAAGIALAIRAAFEIDGGRLAAGLKDGGWAIHLVLVPFMDIGALRRLLGKPVSLSSAQDKSLRYLPNALAPFSLLATACLLAGLALEITAQFK